MSVSGQIDCALIDSGTAIQDFFHNAAATNYTYQTATDISPTAFHSHLPGFKQTPLVHVPQAASGLDHVYIKDESERLGLPSFKILGASWGVCRAITRAYDLPSNTDLKTLREAAQQHKAHLVTATDGNHGRAIARMARLLGIEATVFVPDTVNDYTRGLIRHEGAKVLVEFRDYDATVMIAYEYAEAGPDYLYVQDTSFNGYHDIPAWIVQGYTTMFQEVDEQLNDLGLKATHIITPVGVGSLAHAAVAYCKSDGRRISVVAVESEVAACLQFSLRSGINTPISTRMTVMDGINCGTVSDISWSVLQSGVNGAVTITDLQSHEAVLKLAGMGISAGPCGASTFAALRKLINMPSASAKLGVDQDSVIVLLNTEGSREYTVPT